MAVSLTTNIALAKPDKNEVAENWVNTPALQAANNTIITNKMNVALTSYTPSLISTSSPQPNVGAGSIVGEYCDVQGFVFGNFIVTFLDSGINVGTGEYGISLPFVVDSSFHTVGTALTDITGSPSCVGEGYAYDASNSIASGLFALDVVTISGVSYLRMVTEIYTIPGKSSRVISSGQVFVPANGDQFTGNFFYKRV